MIWLFLFLMLSGSFILGIAHTWFKHYRNAKFLDKLEEDEKEEGNEHNRIDQDSD